MKTSVESINGKSYTVVWHNNILTSCSWDDAERKKWTRYLPVQLRAILLYVEDVHIATALPALPRNPNNDEATVRLLHLYRAHGIEAQVEWDNNLMALLGDPENTEIAHATDTEGNKIEVAIEENE